MPPHYLGRTNEEVIANTWIILVRTWRNDTGFNLASENINPALWKVKNRKTMINISPIVTQGRR